MSENEDKDETSKSLSEKFALERELEKTQKRAETLEAELLEWHKRLELLTAGQVAGEELLMPAMKEKLEAVTYHLRKEKQLVSDLQEKVKEKDREILSDEKRIANLEAMIREKDTVLSYEREQRHSIEELLKKKHVKPSEELPPSFKAAPDGGSKGQYKNLLSESEIEAEGIADEEDESIEESLSSTVITSPKGPVLSDKNIKDILYETEVAAKLAPKSEWDEDDGSYGPAIRHYSGDDIEPEFMKGIEDRVSDQTMHKNGGVTKSQARDWAGKTKTLLRLVLRTGSVKAGDAALLLSQDQQGVVKRAEILEKRGFINIENRRSKNPTYRVTRKMLKTMESMKKNQQHQK